MVKFKFWHNAILLVVTLFLMDARSFYGITFHEIAGLAICLFFILHMALNWRWIVNAIARFFGKASGNVRLSLVLDILLLAGFTLIIISGMAIARTIDFSWIGFDPTHRGLYRTMHTTVSMMVIIILGVHLGLHWKWVMAALKRRS